MVSAINAVKQIKNRENHKISFSDKTMIGALAKYISTPNDNFQPMNANYAILPKLEDTIKDKKLKNTKLSDIALKYLKKDIKTIDI